MMKGRFKGVITVICGLFLLMLSMSAKSKDKEFYETAKTTTGTVKMISTEEKKVRSRRRHGVRRTRTVTKYNAHITYDIEKNGETISQTSLFKDVSSNLKEGDTVTVYYAGEQARIKSESQSQSSNTMMLIFAIVTIAIGIVGYCRSKPENEYDEYSGEENIYMNHGNNHY